MIFSSHAIDETDCVCTQLICANHVTIAPCLLADVDSLASVNLLTIVFRTY